MREDEERWSEVGRCGDAMVGLRWRGGSGAPIRRGPRWRFFSLPRRRSSLEPLHDHHTSRLEDARAGQDAANTLTLSFSQLGSTMLVPGLLVVVSLRTARYRPQLLRVVLRTGLWKLFTTSTRPLSMVHLCCMRLMANGLST